MKKAVLLVLVVGTVIGGAGCASKNTGGTGESYEQGYNGEANYPYSPPTAPALPQSNPQDLRSPNAITTPQPHPLSPP